MHLNLPPWIFKNVSQNRSRCYGAIISLPNIRTPNFVFTHNTFQFFQNSRFAWGKGKRNIAWYIIGQQWAHTDTSKRIFEYDLHWWCWLDWQWTSAKKTWKWSNQMRFVSRIISPHYIKDVCSDTVALKERAPNLDYWSSSDIQFKNCILDAQNYGSAYLLPSMTCFDKTCLITCSKLDLIKMYCNWNFRRNLASLWEKNPRVHNAVL